MKVNTTDNDRMIFMLHKLTDFNEHIKPQQMKEMIKMFGVCAEIFEADFVPFIQRVLKQLEKLMKEDATMKLHGAISEAVGSLVFHVVDKHDSE